MENYLLSLTALSRITPPNLLHAAAGRSVAGVKHISVQANEASLQHSHDANFLRRSVAGVEHTSVQVEASLHDVYFLSCLWSAHFLMYLPLASPTKT
jgi:hypothetical protein